MKKMIMDEFHPLLLKWTSMDDDGESITHEK
jgi:hypothetical protein